MRSRVRLLMLFLKRLLSRHPASLAVKNGTALFGCARIPSVISEVAILLAVKEEEEDGGASEAAFCASDDASIPLPLSKVEASRDSAPASVCSWRSRDRTVAESPFGSVQASRRLTAICWQTTLLITWRAGSAETVLRGIHI